jgi:hypothetical protein
LDAVQLHLRFLPGIHLVCRLVASWCLPQVPYEPRRKWVRPGRRCWRIT